MMTQPTRISRLFSRKHLIIAEQSARQPPQPTADVRELRIVAQLMALGEPARFELAEAIFSETSLEPDQSTGSHHLKGMSAS
ncbi:MAG TPA: hypothetical protein VMT64_09230 [Candidatus Binataceae bacterium]|nr:hypothetical protein [Candidatus Binataceae bacterium]